MNVRSVAAVMASLVMVLVVSIIVGYVLGLTFVDEIFDVLAKALGWIFLFCCVPLANRNPRGPQVR